LTLLLRIFISGVGGVFCLYERRVGIAR